MKSFKPPKRNSQPKKNVVIFLTLVILTGVTLYYLIQKDVFYSEPYVMHLEAGANNVSCHYLEAGDALSTEFSPRPNSIFFHETSCRGGLTSRQACAVESAARAHPRRQVYVLFSAPVSDLVLRRSCLAKLLLFPNVKIARVHLSEYAIKTPLEEIVAQKPFAKSQWWIEHTSDILRYLTLYKWGGVYLDTDVIVAKSLTPLGHNWVAKEDENLVNAAAIAISMDHLGRKLAKALVNEVQNTYRPDKWIHNGPGAITRVMSKFCDTHYIPEWSSNTCGGLEVYGPEYFYPIHYTNRDNYFKAGDLDENTEKAYTHHFWNKLSSNTKIEKDSPYAKMAEKYCPTIYQMYGDQFGE